MEIIILYRKKGAEVVTTSVPLTLGMAIAGAVVGFGGSVAGDWVADRDINWGKAIGAAALGGVTAYIGGPGAQHGQLKARSAAIASRKIQQGLRPTAHRLKLIDRYTAIISAHNTVAINSIIASINYNMNMAFYHKGIFG